METNLKMMYEAPMAEVWEVKTKSTLLQASQQRYIYHSLDEEDVVVNGQEG